jgi:hypothetical protein
MRCFICKSRGDREEGNSFALRYQDPVSITIWNKKASALIVVKNNPPLLTVNRKFIHCPPVELKFPFQPIDEADDIGVKRI